MIDPKVWWAAGWAMVHFLWLGVAIGLVALALRHGARRASPQQRYALALATLCALCVAPLLAFAAVYGGVRPAAVDGVSVALPQVPPPVSTPAPATADAAAPRLAWLSHVIDAAPAVWLSGLAVGVAWLGLALWGTWRLARRARPIELAQARRVGAALGLRRVTRVAVSESAVSPLVLGALRPRVVLPTSILRRTPAELEMVLLHELSHVRRRDNLVNAAQRAVECALFFHPVVWWVSRWARLERERCCDAEVVRHTGEPRRYVHTLLALAAPPAMAQPGLAMSQSPLVERVRTLLQQESHTMNVPRSVSFPALGLLALSATIIGTQAQEPPPAPRPTAAPQPEPAPVALPMLRQQPPPPAPRAPETPLLADEVVPVPAPPAPEYHRFDCRACHHAVGWRHSESEADVHDAHARVECRSCHVMPQVPAAPAQPRLSDIPVPKPAPRPAQAPRLAEVPVPDRGPQLPAPPPGPRRSSRLPGPAALPSVPEASPESMGDRVQRLEATVRELQAELKRMRQKRTLH